MNDKPFWISVDKLVAESKIVIDRPKGSKHPGYPDFIYPVDYGYLDKTTSPDSGGIDVWCGSGKTGVNAIMCTVDLYKRDSEIKILINCNEEETRMIYDKTNDSDLMKGILIRR